MTKKFTKNKHIFNKTVQQSQLSKWTFLCRPEVIILKGYSISRNKMTSPLGNKFARAPHTCRGRTYRPGCSFIESSRTKQLFVSVLSRPWTDQSCMRRDVFCLIECSINRPHYIIVNGVSNWITWDKCVWRGLVDQCALSNTLLQ